MSRFRIFLAAAAVTAATAVILAFGTAGLSSGNRRAAEARSVATTFFRSINERRYERTCALLSAAYYRRNRIPSRRHCVIGLRIGFMWSQEIRFRITSVSADDDRAVVKATANGVLGRIELVRKGGRFKVLAVQGG